jgi:hypothetical protein
MMIPKAWADCTGMLRTEVQSAGLANWKTLYLNADSLIETARSYVQPTTLIDAAFESARRRCKEFAEEIDERGLCYSQSDPASRHTRELALIAIDELEKRLQDARPSDKAIYLGLGW